MRGISSFFLCHCLLALVGPICGTLIKVGKGTKSENSSVVIVDSLIEALELVENDTYILNVSILLTNNEEVLNRSFKFDKVVGFSLQTNDQTVILCSPAGSGLSFLNSSNISIISQVIFVNCGYNFTSDLLNVTWPSIFLFENVQNIIFRNAMFTQSKGTAIKLLNCKGKVLIHKILFSKAAVPITNAQDALVGGGSIYILQASSYTDITIEQCIISSNKILGEGYTRGGAIAAIYNTANNSFLIRGGNINGNHAILGSGLYLAFVGIANHNRVLITQGHIHGHQCYNGTSSGVHARYKCVGTLNIQYLLDPYSPSAGYNNVSMNNTLVSKNVAFAGGAISVSAVRQSTVIAHTNSFILNTFFKTKYNRAQVGSSFYFSELPGPVTSGYLLIPMIEPYVTNSFVTNESNITTGQGAIYSNKMSLFLAPSQSIFEHCYSTAIVMSGADLVVLPGTNATFQQNTGKLGGAIALLNQARLIVRNRSIVIFDGNTANDKGGAVYISNYFDNYALPISRIQCAIQFSESSQFIFKGNTADHKSNAIFATSVLSCADNELITNASINSPFCWPNWYYKNSTCNEQVFTSPATIQKIQTSLNVNVFPGFPFPLPIILIDDYGRDITNNFVVSAFVINGNAAVDSGSQYIAGGNTTIYAHPGAIITVAIETAEPRVVYTELEFKIQQCPPGYHSVSLAKEQNIKGMDCVCGNYPSNVVLCNKVIASARIMSGWCMTYDVQLGMGIIGPWQYVSQMTHEMQQDGYYVLPSTLQELDQFFCKPLKRTGRLCGECEDGYGVPVYSYDNQCVSCDEKKWPVNMILYLLAELLPLTLFFALVIVFNISITSGPAKAFVFFSQMITLPTVMYTVREQINILTNDNSQLESVLLSLYVLPYSIWNLDFFRTVLPPFCLTPHLSTIDVMALAYISALYSLLLIIVVYTCIELHASNCQPVAYVCMPLCHCLSRLRRNWKIQTSFIDAFATFLVLSYTKLCSVSFLLLVPNTIYSPNGEVKGMKLLYMDASVEYVSSKHIWLMVISLVVLSLIVIPLPLILLLYPLQIVQRCLHRTHLNTRALRAFMDSFQGCYRIRTEKTRDARSFSSVYFFLRIIVLAVMMEAMDSVVEGMLQVMILVLVVCLLVLVQPYKKRWNNVLDVFTFCVLILTKVILLVQSVSHHLDKGFVALSIILMLIPLLYMSVYIGCKVVKRVCKKKGRMEMSPNEYNISYSIGLDFPDRIVNPEAYVAIKEE